MKIKNKIFLMYILVLAGAILLGNSQLWAEVYRLPDDPATCDGTKLDERRCFNGWGYIVEIDPEPIIGNQGYGEWPIVNDDGTLEWRYRASIDQDGSCKKTWSFFVQRQNRCLANSIVDSDPPGAQLTLPGDTLNKCDIDLMVADEYYGLLKWNPSVNCQISDPVIFSLTTTAEIRTSPCNYSVIQTSGGCEGGYLLGPSCLVPLETTRIFDEGNLTVDFNQCDGGMETVSDEEGALDPQPAYICDEVIDEVTGALTLDCYKINAAGPRSSGCVIYANPTYYLYGGDSYRR